MTRRHPLDTTDDLPLAIYEALEATCWPPWLRFTPADLREHRTVFPDGQITLFDRSGSPKASLETVRVDWDGDVASLPTWDDVAGVGTGYRSAHRPDGNTIALLSVSVRHDERRSRLPIELITALRERFAGTGVRHIIGDFRPSDFGRHKRVTGDLSFRDYVDRTRDDGLPADGWLRSVIQMGGELLRIDPSAMVVTSTVERFDTHRVEHHPERWWEVTASDERPRLLAWHRPLRFLTRVEEIWECGEAGTWYVDRPDGMAVYIESNVWGRLT